MGKTLSVISRGASSEFKYTASVESVGILIIDENNYEKIIPLESSIDEICNELSECEFYQPSNFLSIIIGRTLNLTPTFEDKVSSDFVLPVPDVIGKILAVSSEFKNSKLNISEDIIDTLFKIIDKDPYRYGLLKILFYLLAYTNNDEDKLIDKLVTKESFNGVYYSFDSTYEKEEWKRPLLKVDEDSYIKILKRIFKLSKIKNEHKSAFSILIRTVSSERIPKSYEKNESIYSFDILKKDNELFDLFKLKLNRYCKYISRTSSYSGVSSIFWLADYIDWDIFNIPIISSIMSPEQRNLLPNIFKEKKNSEYESYIKSFSEGHDYAIGKNTAFLDLCNSEEFKEIVSEIAEEVMTYYRLKRLNVNSYSLNTLKNKENAILLMNTLIPIIEKAKSDKYFKEFKVMFNTNGIIEHIDFGGCKEFKKKFLKSSLVSK